MKYAIVDFINMTTKEIVWTVYNVTISDIVNICEYYKNVAFHIVK